MKPQVTQPNPAESKQKLEQARKRYDEYKANLKQSKADDGFEVVGNRHFTEDSDSSDIDSLPVMLGIKVAETEPINTVLRDMLLPVCSSAGFKKLSSQEQDDFNLIRQLLVKSKSHNGGWTLVSDLTLPCLNVERDELIAENSKIFGGF